MKLLIYIFLGFIQGFTEPIPISSSGHLIIFKSILNVNELHDLNFEIIVNFGSLLAILYFYKDELINIIKDFFMYIKTKEEKYFENFKYSFMIVIACIPAGIIGLLFKDKIESIGNVKIVGLSLLITGLLLFLIRNINGYKEKKDITVKEAIIIGLFQIIALFPGISRSGSTIVGGMTTKLNRETAFKFSFMLYIPISFGTMLLGVKDLCENGNIGNLFLPYTLGMITSMVVTYYSIKWFKNVMQKGNLKYFVYYCLILGTITILFIK